MRDKKISFINIEYSFEHNFKFVNIVKNQFLWMKRFHEVWVNIKHVVVKKKNDIMKLIFELRRKMIYRLNRRILQINKTTNLLVIKNHEFNQIDFQIQQEVM